MSRHHVTVDGESSLTTFAATTNVTRHFCKRCGGHLYTVDARFPVIVGVPGGALSDEELVRPRSHYFVTQKAVWHSVSDPLPQFGGDSGVEPQGT